MSSEELVLGFMDKENRPYNVGNVADAMSMRGGMKKSEVTSALSMLESKQLITAKEFGKTKVYFARQDKFEVPSEADAEAMDKEITACAEELEGIAQSCKDLTAGNRTLKAAPSDDELETKIRDVERQNAALEQQLTRIQGSGQESVTEAELECIKAAHTASQQHWRKRRRWCMDALDTITENMSKKPKKFAVQFRSCHTESGF